MYPGDLIYTETHEWVRREEGGVATIGITEFAVKSLSDIVFLELPEKGRKLQKGAPFGAVESVKAVFDLNSPVTGEVVEVNSGLADDFGPLKEDPYSAGWMMKIQMENPGELDGLMDAQAYSDFAQE